MSTTEDGWPRQVADLVDGLVDGLDPLVRRQVDAMLDIPDGNGPPSHAEVRDIVKRVTGEITFDEFVRRNRSHRAGG